jgi:putative acetyltransferase
VITPTRGLQPPDTIVDAALLREFVGVDLGSGDPRYLEPLVRDLRHLSTRLAPGARAVLLGSVATAKYLEPIADVLGDRLVFPRDFIGRGDMSRGALLLQRVDANHELDYVPFASGVVRRGPLAPGVAKPRSSRRVAMEPQMPAPHHDQPRDARADEIDALASLWHEGWHDGHAGHVPDGLTAARTLTAFHERTPSRVADTAVAVAEDGSLEGFVMVVDDEVEQVFVARSARGTGLASDLLVEAEQRVAAGGHDSAWLAVVVGNARARRFYERQGWVDGGNLPYEVSAGGQTFVSPCRRYVKDVRGVR